MELTELEKVAAALGVVRHFRQKVRGPKSKEEKARAKGKLVGAKKVGRAPKGWLKGWAAPPTKWAVRYIPKFIGSDVCGNCKHFDEGHCKAVQEGNGEHAQVVAEGNCFLWLSKTEQGKRATTANLGKLAIRGKTRGR